MHRLHGQVGAARETDNWNLGKARQGTGREQHEPVTEEHERGFWISSAVVYIRIWM